MLRPLTAAAVLVLLFVGPSSGCSLLDEECGLLEGQPSVYVRVTDAASGRPVLDGVEVTARDGDFSEVLVVDGGQYVGVFGRPGTYVVTAAGGGYRAGSESVVVGTRECGGRAYADEVLVEIALSPATP